MKIGTIFCSIITGNAQMRYVDRKKNRDDKTVNQGRVNFCHGILINMYLLIAMMQVEYCILDWLKA
jgi:hypothetical protein